MQHPRLDEHLVEGETREEILRGERIYAAPAREPHAERHFELDYVIRAHVKDEYIGASDMLTRAGPGSEFATDTAVRKRGIDPETNTRYLEELAFEVVSTQSMREMIMRAEDLSTRGVRRLLAIFVGVGVARNEVCEWSVAEHRFVTLSLDDSLIDPTLARPIPIRALLDAALADDAVVDALDSKGNRRLRALMTREHERGLEQGMTNGLEQGMNKGLMEGIESICRILGVELSSERRAGLHELDTAGLERLLTQLETERRWP